MTLQNYRLILKMIDEQGWILRNIIIWHKPNHMPSSAKDRFSNSYEPVFMLVKRRKYWSDLDAVREPYTGPLNRWGGEKLKAKGQSGWDKGTGQQTYRDRDMRPNKLGKHPGDIWRVPTHPFPGAHFATFPPKLVEPMIKFGCPQWICKKCGKARERITEIAYKIKSKSISRSIKEGKEKEVGLVARNFTGNALHYTLGWTNCGCNAGWRSGVVLDPFMGAGTTAVVANKLKRDWVGMELNEEYIKIAKERIRKHPKPML